MTNWTTPISWPFGFLATEAALNANLRDNPQYLKEQVDDAHVRLFRDSTTINNGTTVETTLGTYTLPAADPATFVGLYEDGQSIRVEAFGTWANTANTKTWRIYLGATSITLASFAAAGIDPWMVEATIVRTGIATQKIRARFSGALAGSQDRMFYLAATENLATPLVIKITGQSSAASSDITEQDFVVYRQ